jgi:hypothetical protein
MARKSNRQSNRQSCLRSLYPPKIRIAIICDNVSPHLTAKKDKRRTVGRGEQCRDRLHADELILVKRKHSPLWRRFGGSPVTELG